MRLFIALVPPLPMRERLARTRDLLRQSGADVKWVETENLHLTLQFLGHVDDDRLSLVQAAFARAVSGHRTFHVRFRGCGVFPNRRRPRVVWTGVEGAEEPMRALHDDVEAALAELGFAREARPFSPHLTLGRVRTENGAARLVERLDGLRSEDHGQMTVDTVSLMESQLSARGPTYRHVHDVTLTPGT